jgi:hypothetical protein
MNFMHPKSVLDAASCSMEALLTNEGSVRVPCRELGLRTTGELFNIRVGKIVQG